MPVKEMPFSEEQLGKKLDRCASDTIIKGSGGLIIGSVMSLIFLKDVCGLLGWVLVSALALPIVLVKTI